MLALQNHGSSCFEMQSVESLSSMERLALRSQPSSTYSTQRAITSADTVDGYTRENSRTSASQSERRQRQNTVSDLGSSDSGSSTSSSREREAHMPPPKYPEYTSLQSRLDSYVGWPQRVVGVSPASLAASGFFYIGSADRVRCFQCGVTLRNWEPEDDPATEHVTWSPACPVALLPPGLDSQTGFRDVQAPPESAGGAESREIESASRNFEQLGVHVAGAGSNDEGSTTQCGEAQSCEAPAQSGENAVSTAAGLEPPSVLAVLELGCSRDAVDRVRERRRRLQGTDFPDAVSLYMAVMQEESADQAALPSLSDSPPQPQQLQASASSVDSNTASKTPAGTTPSPSSSGIQSSGSVTEPTSSPSSLSPSGGASQIRGKQPRFRQCKVCLQGEVTVTFLPCGHLIACSECAEKCQACPRCGRTILGTVRTYFA